MQEGCICPVTARLQALRQSTRHIGTRAVARERRALKGTGGEREVAFGDAGSPRACCAAPAMAFSDARDTTRLELLTEVTRLRPTGRMPSPMTELPPLPAAACARLHISLGNRILRVVWTCVWNLLGRWSPRPFHEWRRWILRIFGAQLARGVKVYPGVRIWAPWLLTMDEDACLGEDVDCYTQARITIGRRAFVSQRSFLCAGTHDYTLQDCPLMAAPITIGAQAWICAQAIVGPGVSIGEGAVLGAGSVAMKSMPAWTVCAGNPCVPIKPRVMKP